MIDRARVPVRALALPAALALACQAGGPASPDAFAPTPTESEARPVARLSPGALDLGPGDASGELVVGNVGDAELSWSLSGPSWADLSPASGRLAPGATTAVVVTPARAALPPGTHSGEVVLASDGGRATATLTVTVAGPDAPPDGGDADADQGVALEGRVVDQFSGGGVDGVTVAFDGRTAVSDADGRFRVEGASSGDLRALALTKSGATHPRETFARTGDGEWRVIPRSFDMAAFDDVAREFEPRTIRWTQGMRVYFDVTPPAGWPPGSEYDVWVQEVRGALLSFVADWTTGEIGAAALEVGTSPPATGAPGWIVVGFSEDPADYGGTSSVGRARTFWSGDRSITSARIWLRYGSLSGPGLAHVRRGVLGHEIGHAMGMGHMDGVTASLMTPVISESALTAFDRRAGGVLYTRSPGNVSPDTDSSSTYRGGLIGAAVGRHEWVCDPPERAIR